MKKLTISPATIGKVEANVSLNEAAKAYYDKTANQREMMTVLPGSMFTNKHTADGWIPDNLEELTRHGYLEKKANGYLVLKPVWGSPSGTAAAIQGKDGPKKPSGYELWSFPDGRTITEAGEKPE